MNYLLVVQVFVRITPGSALSANQQTEQDAEQARSDSGYWERVAEVIGDRPVIVIGHSLRDQNARRVLLERGSGAGLYVSVNDDPMDDILCERFNLTQCVSTADEFLQSYEAARRSSV